MLCLLGWHGLASAKTIPMGTIELRGGSVQGRVACGGLSAGDVFAATIQNSSKRNTRGLTVEIVGVGFDLFDPATGEEIQSFGKN